MNSEGITLKVLKPIFLSFTKCILNVHVLKMKEKNIPEHNVFEKWIETQQSLLFLMDFICGLCN